MGLDAWESEQFNKKELLEKALAEYDSGRSKNAICLSFLFFTIDTINDLLRRAEKEIGSSDIKVRAKEFRKLLQAFIEKAEAKST